MANANENKKQTQTKQKEANAKQPENETKTDVEQSGNANANDVSKTENAKTENSGEVDKNENEVREFLTLAEAYKVMLKGGVFRFAEWDKRKIAFVAFVPRGMTTIMIAPSPEHNTRRVLRPSQEEAIKKLWYQVK